MLRFIIVSLMVGWPDELHSRFESLARNAAAMDRAEAIAKHEQLLTDFAKHRDIAIVLLSLSSYYSCDSKAIELLKKASESATVGSSAWIDARMRLVFCLQQREASGTLQILDEVERHAKEDPVLLSKIQLARQASYAIRGDIAGAEKCFHALMNMKERPNNIHADYEWDSIRHTAANNLLVAIRYKLEWPGEERIAAIGKVRDAYPWLRQRSFELIEDIKAEPVPQKPVDIARESSRPSGSPERADGNLLWLSALGVGTFGAGCLLFVLSRRKRGQA